MRDILGQPIPPGKRKYTGLSLRDAMLLIPAAEFAGWDMAVLEHEPGGYLRDTLTRLTCFDMTGSEAAKLMLIDAVLLEEIPRHERLKAWKGESLDTGILFFTVPVSLLADS